MLPEWDPRQGTVEMALIDSLSVLTGLQVAAIEVMQDNIVEQLVGLRGITRDQGIPAHGRVRFTVTGSAPVQEIPAGTMLRYTVPSTGESFDLVTVDSVAIITSEQLTGDVSVEATEVGDTPNGTPVGITLDVVDSLPFVESAVIAETLTGGAGVESDESFRSRASAGLSRFTATALTLPEHFQSEALTRPGVGRALVLNNTTPGSSTSTPGHVTVAVADPAGEPLAPSLVTDLSDHLTGMALASLTIHVAGPSYTSVDVQATVTAAPGVAPEVVQVAVQEAVARYLNPAVWDWSPVVGQYALAAVVGAAPGVRSVVTVPGPISLPGLAPLPRVGTVTVTVQ